MNGAATKPLHILCLSHLVWERKLFQRPQQLMTQFELLGHSFLYVSLMSLRRFTRGPVDERDIAIGKHGRARNRPFLPLSGRVKPIGRLSVDLAGRDGKQFLESAPRGRRVLWLQNPIYASLADKLSHDLLVYDIMDPFGAFQKSADDIMDRERRLLKRADVVFTGGNSLHRQREGQNPNMHCFPSGIDFAHFAKGAAPGDIPQDLRELPRPVLGYFGAVDERIDWELMRTLCRALPDCSVVFLGPLILMNEVPLKEPNFHYLGPKPYDALPDYLRGFDVCLIPWLVNELTRFMSPTKTPEYLAAGRPVVSTAIPDVMADYTEDVSIAANADEYIAACKRAIRQGIGPSRKPPQARTWREIAEAMVVEMEKALVERKSLVK